MGPNAQTSSSLERRDEMFQFTRSLTANINTKFLQRYIIKYIEFADANNSLFLKGIIILYVQEVVTLQKKYSNIFASEN